jgi:hypothetical protein
VPARLLIGDIYGIVCVEPLLSRLRAQQYIQAGDILRNRDLGRPFRLIACGGDGYGRQIRGLIETIDDAICPNDGGVTDMNVG